MIEERVSISVENQRTFVAHFRWVICALLFFAATINYIDRQVIGILKPTLQTEIGWTEIGYSWVVVSFQAAYAIGLLGIGRLIDRIGTRKGFSLSIIFWSVAAMGHALARTVFGFGIARFFLGLGKRETFRLPSKLWPSGFRRKNAHSQPESSTPAQTSARLSHHSSCGRSRSDGAGARPSFLLARSGFSGFWRGSHFIDDRKNIRRSREPSSTTFRATQPMR